MRNTDYVYFLYSNEQITEKNNVLKASGKTFNPGFVVVNGNRKKFTQITTNKEAMNRFVDAEIVCEGVLGNITYTNPSES